MSLKSLTVVFSLIGIITTLDGCVSSEETGAGDRAKNPVQIFGSIDTTRYVAGHDANRDAKSRSKIDTAKLNDDRSQRIAPNFKSKQDTVMASVIRKSKSLSRSRINVEPSEHAEQPAFTVQIGAFVEASNALRVQKRAKEQFINQPVFNRFVKRENRYLVSIGRYEDRKYAFTLCDSMKQKYPKEYDQCWINLIP